MTGASNAAETMSIVVADAPGRERHEIYVDGELAGFTLHKTRPASSPSSTPKSTSASRVAG
jgi:hypothetical protein